MFDKTTLVKVRNRDNGVVGYIIPEMGNLRRRFSPEEVKEISVEELTQLSYLPGGVVLLKNYLIVENQEVLQFLLNSEVEPEYFYSKKDVTELLLNGTLDQLEDCLDFAPSGVIDMVKDEAVRLRINDLAKREAILKKTQFNVTNAIKFNDEVEKPETEEKKQRRSAPIKTPTVSKPTRRVSAPKYTVKETNDLEK